MQGHGKSRLENGLIYSPTHLELIVTDHCNLNCNACNHASPLMPAWFADPDSVHRSFSIMAKYYRPRFVKVIGGEPLLHKHLGRVVEAARSTGISDHFTLVTNGVLLRKASEAVWQAIDEFEVSLYPGVPKTKEDIVFIQEKADALGKKLTIFSYEQFRATFSLKGTRDKGLIDKVYAACKNANVWGCHAIREGYFYKCPQIIYAAKLTGKSEKTDRIPIVDSDTFQAALLDYANSSTPPSACAFCTGTVGIQQPLTQLPREHLSAYIDKSLEENIDHDWLARSLTIMDTRDDCKILNRFKVPRVFDRYPLLKRLISRRYPNFMAQRSLRQKDRPDRKTLAESCLLK